MHIVTDNSRPQAHSSLRKADTKPAPRSLAWKPQPSGLSRDEIRQIVLDTIG